MCGDEPMCSRQ